MSESIFGITVNRLCRIRSEGTSDQTPFPLDEHGFLDPSAAQAASSATLIPGALVRPEVAAAAGALVLLGEPGLGKSTVLAAIADQMRERNCEVHRVSGADVTDDTFEDLLGQPLRALPGATNSNVSAQAAARPSALQTGCNLVLLLDQVDESPMIPRLAGRIYQATEGRDTSQLMMLLGCRTAEYPPRLTQVLTSLCGSSILADLAPLTNDEATRLASSVEGVDGVALISAAIEAGASSLACVPLTLDLLVRSYRETGVLEGGPIALFSRGVSHLLEEPDKNRLADFAETTLEQRQALAGRVAARLVLSGRRTIWLGRVLEANEHDLSSESLAGGREQAAGGAFEVTKPHVREFLRTAMFTGRGEDRLVFRHGSLESYLAARYLVNCRLPVEQLRTLLLVATDDARSSVPESLRETAAWLVGLNPASASWLAEADPESLAGHSAIVDSDETRKLIVESLLIRADEVELGDVPWARSPRRLRHAGLADQLRGVLEEAGSHEPEDWSSLARVRLAVRLADETHTPGLADPLLDLADSRDWSATMRALASHTAFNTEPTIAIPRLREILSRFEDIEYATSADPDDEFRGLLLEMLWPDHLNTEDVLPHLRPRRKRNLIGSYLAFERRFGDRLPESDVSLTLDWICAQVGEGRPRLQEIEHEDNPTGHDSRQDADIAVTFDPELIEGVVSRALSCERALQFAEPVARILYRDLTAYESPPIPRAIDVQTSDGGEPPSVREVRLALARELVKVASAMGNFDRGLAWVISSHWSTGTGMSLEPEEYLLDELRRANRTSLLDTDDFRWAYKAAAQALSEGDQRLADALGLLAEFLFDPSDTELLSLVWSNQDHPGWKHLNWLFDPVPLDNEYAQRARESKLRRVTRETPANLAEAEQFRSHLQNDLAAAAGGDCNAFWRLAWNLQFDPQSRRGNQRLDDDLMAFPGVAALSSDASDLLIQAAVHYVREERDYADEWLGTDQYDKRAWAGYLALALVERRDRTAEVPESAWRSWTGALIWFPAVPFNAGERSLKVQLLKKAAQFAPDALSHSVRVYVAGGIALGRLVSEVELVDPAWHAQLTAVWVELLSELSAAISRGRAIGSSGESAAIQGGGNSSRVSRPMRVQLQDDEQALARAMDLWDTMLRALLESDAERAARIARGALARRASSARGRMLAVRAGWVLLCSDVQTYWGPVQDHVRADEEFGRTLALQWAEDRHEDQIVPTLSEDQLVNAYTWLSELFPPKEDSWREGARVLKPSDQARLLRDQVLNELVGRGSDDAVRGVKNLSLRFPDRLNLRSGLIRARAARGAMAWVPPKPEEVVLLLQDGRRRLVRSADELASLLQETIAAVESDLHGHWELLWDRLPPARNGSGTTVWRPKPEAALSAYLAHELTQRCRGHGLAVNREVLVRPTNEFGAGDRTDIQIEATARNDVGGRLAPHERQVVVMEVKGCWNPSLRTDQRTQLAQRYLPEAGTEAGIYLVGWYPPDLWTDEFDRRRTRVAQLDRPALKAELEAQAEAIRTESGHRVTAILFSVPGPTVHSE